jgi:cysteine desulfurase
MALKRPVYLDHHSTTPVDPRVVEAMLPYLTEHFGNAASKHHRFGWTAEAAVERARKQIALLVGAEADEVIFTSGATESINLALKGVAEAYRNRGTHIVTVATEHKAVLDTCQRLKHAGFEVTYLAVDSFGRVEPDALLENLRPSTILVSIMAANNEIGTIAPLEALGALCRERGILFHTDAAQAAGKIPIDMRGMSIDLLSLSGHKLYGPKGIGALVVRKTKPAIRLVPQMDGGGHERGFRSGTLNVPAIVGFGVAAELCRNVMTDEQTQTALLRDRLVAGIVGQLDDVRSNGDPEHRLPNNANLTFAGVRADRLIMDMKDIAVSTGSACSSASPEPSHVLKAIGLKDPEVLASVRFGIGRFNTTEEIDYAVRKVVETVRLARAQSSVYQMAQS